jgi:hypothetical protein
MPTYKKKEDFFATEDGKDFVKALKKMAADNAYSTDASYSANSELYPDNTISFVNKHIEYIRNHPSTDPGQYLANLRLMTRKR